MYKVANKHSVFNVSISNKMAFIKAICLMYIHKAKIILKKGVRLIELSAICFWNGSDRNTIQICPTQLIAHRFD